jgi:GntR family transcriptional regulator / MocR family aminotransferase
MMTGPAVRFWDLNLPVKLNRHLHMPLFQQLARQITDEIRRGRLAPGTALPGSRELAAELGINRKTVVLAYDDLIAQGWLASHPQQGTFVSPDLPETSFESGEPSRAGVGGRYADRQYDIVDAAADTFFAITGAANNGFDDGLPDTRLLPIQELGRAYRSALLHLARSHRLYYGDPKGSLVLREAISRMLNADRGITTSPDNICLTRGSQMGIFLATRVLSRPGDTVAVEALTYPPAYDAFRAIGANVTPIRVDELGIDVDHLEEVCRKTPIKSIYLTPHHHFPTTVVLAPERRMRLLSIAEQFRFSIIEDDYDHEYNFQFRPLLPMASFAPSKVIYVGSFSKILSPNLRLGYVVASKDTIDAFARQIVMLDRQGDQAVEMAVAEILTSGELARHARRALNVYRARRDSFASLLRANFGELIRFQAPSGGLAVWIEFAEQERIRGLKEKARAKGFSLLASDSFRMAEFATHGLRLGFASKNNSEMAEAIRRLKVLSD